MYGIDISNWQSSLNLREVAAQIDFAIVKATEGLGYVDSTCDKFVQELNALNKLWGFYHFARGNDPTQEAKFFYDNCKNYFGHGMPVLDYETSENQNRAQWVETFCKEVYKLSGVKPLVYVSASWVNSVASKWVCENCGLWLAGYPSKYTVFDDYNMPYSPSPWPFVAIWQFTSSLRLRGYAGDLDGNIAYMDKKAWLAYANNTGSNSSSSADSNRSNNSNNNHSITSEQALEKIAQDVINGKYGNGSARKEAIYKAVQNKVNRLLGE